MAKVTLSDGRELTGDMYKLSIGDYRQLLNKDQEQSEEDEMIGRVFGLTGADIVSLPYPDYRLITRRFFELCAAANETQKN